MDNTLNEEIDAAELEEKETGLDKPKEFNEVAAKRAKFEVKSITFNNKVKHLIRADRASWIRNLNYLDGKPFDFSGRDYLLPIYNGRYKQLLLKFSRQCEKCVKSSSIVTDYFGKQVRADALVKGDILAGFDLKSGHQTKVEVLASESNGVKEIAKITFRASPSIEVTLNHPLYKLEGWTEAGSLKVGDRVASPRTIGGFGWKNENFETTVWHGFFEQDVPTKKLPDGFHTLDRQSTVSLLRVLWEVGGRWLESKDAGQVELAYCTQSPHLKDQVRILLRKFGIITKVKNYDGEAASLGYLITLAESSQGLVEDDIFWDEIVSIEKLPPDETWAIQTSNETFIHNFILQHNSTFLANSIIADSAVIPYNKSVYVSPSYLQTRQFSAGKLTPWMEDSPVISKYLLSSKVSRQVFEKGLTNGSMIFLRSAFLNADRIRGLSASMLCVDEIQNFISANLPVIMEVLSHAEDPTALFSGTPLTNDNILEQKWQESSQCEWLVRCSHHTPPHYNFLDERCIGLKGPICNKCGKPLNPADGKWVAFSNERYIMGFHLNQIMVPWMQVGEKWQEIVHKYNTYSKGLFYNEVLGISFDSASKPVTRSDLIACTGKGMRLKTQPDIWTENWQCVMGVDWGTGSDGSERDEKGRLRTASYTIVCIGAYIGQGVFHPFFYRRYLGDDAIPTNCIQDIIYLFNWFKCVLIGADWGFGWAANDQLEATFGMHRVIKYQYVGMQRERMKYDETAHKVIVNRTEVMSDFFVDIKKRKYEFPIWEDSQKYLVDIEHIFAEMSSLGTLKYDHKKTEPDDVAHATIFCKETADKLAGLW